jgi:hypothetical protein
MKIMAKSNQTSAIAIPNEVIMSKIYLIRGQKVMLDSDLAELYETETKVLKQAVKRNIDIFPDHFMFELTEKEFKNLRSQFVTSNWGGQRYLPYVFTEHGVLQLASVLKSTRIPPTPSCKSRPSLQNPSHSPVSRTATPHRSIVNILL